MRKALLMLSVATVLLMVVGPATVEAGALPVGPEPALGLQIMDGGTANQHQSYADTECKDAPIICEIIKSEWVNSSLVMIKGTAQNAPPLFMNEYKFLMATYNFLMTGTTEIRLWKPASIIMTCVATAKKTCQDDKTSKLILEF